MSLKPRNIVQAAEADLARRKRNMLRHKGEPTPGHGDETEIYAFYAPHVRKAKNARQLIEMAWKQPFRGLQCEKKNTRLIYHAYPVVTHKR
jgi:hypothetical protein